MAERGPIENTSRRDPLLNLVGMLGSSSEYIEGMEAAGQRQIVNSDRLPVEIKWSTQADLEALGFVFGEHDPGDNLFRKATLPAGWKREASDHSMWSYLVDEAGKRRVAVFYKAAFYDRRAFMRLEPEPEGGESDG